MSIPQRIKRRFFDFGGRARIAELEAKLKRTKDLVDEHRKQTAETKKRLDLWQSRFELFSKGPSQARGEGGDVQFGDEAAALLEYGTLCAIRAATAVKVDQPLVLISQIQRSGGTFLSQLFDGHPECHAHAHELHIGNPTKSFWPALDVSGTPDEWFDSLQEESATIAFRTGFTKPGDRERDWNDAYPFLLPPGLQRMIFTETVKAAAASRQRDVLDAYFTSYFNGWLDNQNLYTPSKKLVTAFVPTLSSEAGQLELFFADYPDGWFISVVRDPRGWYASAKRHSATRWTTLEEGCAEWTRSTQAALDAAQRWPDRTIIVSFEELLGDADRMFATIARRIGIAALPAEPTFNGYPAIANSSFPISSTGVIVETARRHEQVVAEEDAQQLLALTSNLHSAALEARLRIA